MIVFTTYLRTVMATLFLVAFAVFPPADPAQAAPVDETLSSAKREGRIVMLELGSVGCIPCDMMKPVMEKLSRTYKGKLDVIFVDAKKDKETARRFGVYAIPVQVFLDREGKEFHRHIGYYPYEQIVPVLKKAGL